MLSLARGLHARGHHVTVVLPSALAPRVAAFQTFGVEVIPLAMRKVFWPLSSTRILYRLVRVGIQGRPDIVHIHSQEAGLSGRVIARAAGARAIVYTPQVIDIRRARWHGLYVAAEWLLAHSTARLVSVSTADRQRMIRWGIPAEKIDYIPNSVAISAPDGPVDAQAVRQAFGLAATCPLVMQVGRLSAQKNPLAFVEGAAQVLQTHPEARFVLIGEGPLREALIQRIADLALQDAVQLLGWRDNAVALMAAADVVTLTSAWEGAPYTLLEAMAQARPVVAPAVNGCPDIVVDGETGFLTPPGDTSAWARAVSALLADPELARAMGQRGYARVRERFAPTAMITAIEALYYQVLAAR